MEQREELQDALSAEGFRLPLLDYSEAVREVTVLERIVERAQKAWFRLKVRQLTPSGLVQEALRLRRDFTERLEIALDEATGLQGFQRKRRIPRLRFLAGRLTYLGTEESLSTFSGALRGMPEVRLLSEVFKAIPSRDVTDLLPLGVNAVQAAAQVLRLTGSAVSCRSALWSQAECQGLALLRLNGLSLENAAREQLPKDELNRFAEWCTHGPELMRSKDPFIREIACLHGMDRKRRHQAMLDSAFDRDERLAFDAVSQLQASSYC